MTEETVFDLASFGLDDEFSELSREEATLLSEILRRKAIGDDDMFLKLASEIYEEVPVDVETFVFSEQYLNLRGVIHPRIFDLLLEVDRPSVREVYLCLGKGSGKSFLVACMMARGVYNLLCLKDPQVHLGKAPGSPIYVLNLSVSQAQARDVVFAEFTAMIEHAPWFNDKFEVRSDRMFFPKNITAVSGHSSSRVFLGYNTIYGTLDEVSFMMDSQRRIAAQELYETVLGSTKTRFPDHYKIMMISSVRSQDDYLIQRFDDLKNAGIPIVLRCGPDEEIEAYRTDTKFGAKAPTWAIHSVLTRGSFDEQFKENPRQAWRDFGSVPFMDLEAALRDPDVMKRQVNRDRKHPLGEDGEWAPWFRGSYYNYYLHIDLAGRRDAVGIALGHYDEQTDLIVVDYMDRIAPEPGMDFDFDGFRNLIFQLSGRGFRLKKVTFDSWQSWDMIQNLEKRGYAAETFSVDRNSAAYDTLIEQIMLGRLDYYAYEPFISEMQHLQFVNGRKYDHPPRGSKDVSDAVAAVVCHCILDRDVNPEVHAVRQKVFLRRGGRERNRKMVLRL